MKTSKPTYQELERRLAVVEPIIEALKRQEVDAVVGEEKIAFLLLRNIEESWLESNGEFSAMFNLDGVGMFQADFPALHFTRVNAKFCEIIGYSVDELLTKKYPELTFDQDRKLDLKALAPVIRGEKNSWSMEKRLIRKEGGVIWVSVHGVAMRDHHGQAARVMAMIEDVTARKAATTWHHDSQKTLKKLLPAWTAEMLQMRRTLRGQVARRERIDQLFREMREFIDRIEIQDGDKASTSPVKLRPKRVQAATRKRQVPSRRKATRKPRRKSR